MVGAIKNLIKLALVALVVHAGVRIVPVFWNYVRFRDACEEIAKFSSKKSAEEVHGRIVAKAAQYDIPVLQNAIFVTKQGPVTFVKADYTAQLEYFPTRFYPYAFRVDVQGAPPTYEAYTQ
jgi:hypothetical protein